MISPNAVKTEVVMIPDIPGVNGIGIGELHEAGRGQPCGTARVNRITFQTIRLVVPNGCYKDGFCRYWLNPSGGIPAFWSNRRVRLQEATLRVIMRRHVVAADFVQCGSGHIAVVMFGRERQPLSSAEISYVRNWVEAIGQTLQPL